MDKIRALLEQLGGSKELVDQIVESLESYRNKVKEDTQQEYKSRLAKAKEACLEEVNDYKRELARKTQIFFESRAEKIEQQIARQVAVKDSAAEAKLQQIVALLEGVEVNGNGNDAEIRAAKKRAKELQEQIRKLESGRKILVEKANRAHAVAEKTLERNRVLSMELSEALKKSKQPLTEDKAKAAKTAKTAAKTAKTAEAEAATAEAKDSQSEAPILEGKKPDPAITRRTSDDKLAKKQGQKREQQEPPQSLAGSTPESIAATMDV